MQRMVGYYKSPPNLLQNTCIQWSHSKNSSNETIQSIKRRDDDKDDEMCNEVRLITHKSQCVAHKPEINFNNVNSPFWPMIDQGGSLTRNDGKSHNFSEQSLDIWKIIYWSYSYSNLRSNGVCLG